MKKPKIGVLWLGKGLHRIKAFGKYKSGIKRAGGVPVKLMPTTDTRKLEEYAKKCDGFVFPGGADIDPAIYKEQKLECCGAQFQIRDNFETALLPIVMKNKKSILGICRGIQLINAVLGGTLWQDIQAQRPDVQKSHNFPDKSAQGVHKVLVTEGTLLGKIVREKTLLVNSMHHQAVKDTAQGLHVCAVSDDGIIEAVEMPSYPFLLAVQWHPEHLAAQEAVEQGIFDAFVAAAADKAF
ncbi:MAG: gamma-glutamyl-gamma-aminobutyrate hydrolase family protein [Oscillospiraceae bacterium]